MHFACEKCSFSTNYKQNYNNHLKSRRHNEPTNTYTLFFCEKCKKSYKSSVGLWKHNKKCIITDSNNNNNDLIEIINKQSETINSMKEQQNEIIETVKLISQKPFTNNNNGIINNITILNMLNNNYDNVITFEEFIKNIQICYDDIEEIKDVDSCIECLNNIIIKRLKEYDVHKRPFHCIKDEDINAETFLKQKEWVHEYIRDYDNNTPVLDEKVVRFIGKVNEDIEIMNIDNETKMNLKKILKGTTKKNNIAEIKTGIFYGININKYELNHNLQNSSLEKEAN